jgi:hypothetical protein
LVKVFTMAKVKAVEEASGRSWQRTVLNGLKRALIEKDWCGGIYLRGSLAAGAEDYESDIDLAVTVADDAFDGALHDLSSAPPPSLRQYLPPWLDSLVRDFGGIGHVYLLQLDERKWAQADIYLLPHSRRRQLLGHEITLCLHSPENLEERSRYSGASIKLARRRYKRNAAQDVQQAVLACYIAMLLLRKRLIRGDSLQSFADTYAAAQSVKDLAVLTCYPDRPEHGWHGLLEVAQRSPDPALILKVLSTFMQQVVSPSRLSCRVAMLHEMVGLLAPATWRDNGGALLSLGRFLCSQPPEC